MKRIVIICQGRTGSTNLSDFYKKKYKIKNLGEVFRRKVYIDSPDTLISELSNKPTWIVKLIPLQVLRAAISSFLKKKFPQNIFNNKIRVLQHLENFQNSGTNYKYYREYEKEITQEAIDICLKIIDISDHHCYLYRKNFVSQVKSLVNAELSKEYGPNRIKEKIYAPDERIKGTYNSLVKTYELIKMIYEKSPNDIISTESLTVRSTYNPIVTKGNFDIISNYDVEKEVFNMHSPH